MEAGAELLARLRPVRYSGEAARAITFSAGTIEAVADLDRTPFQRGLALCRQEAEDFAKQRYSVKVGIDLDTAAAEAKLAALRRKLAADTNSRIRLDIDTRRSEESLVRTDRAVRSIGASAKQAGADAKSGLWGPLIEGAVIAGPALIPLAAGLAGISTAALGFGLVGLLAFKGAKVEIAAGTVVGKQYKATIDSITGSVKTFEQTAARGVVKPFQQLGVELNRQAPQLNSFIAKISGPVGSTIAGLGDSLIHLLTAMEPLIETAVTDVDKLVGKFDAWASGPGGAKFFAELQRDIPLATDAIGSLFGTVGHVLAGLAPAGEAVLRIIDGISGVLNAIPQPVITFLLTALVGWRVYALAAAASNKLLALSGVEAASATIRETIAVTDNTAALLANIAAARAAALARGGALAAGLGPLGLGRGALAGWNPIVAGGAGAPVPIPPEGGGLRGALLPFGRGVLRAAPWLLAGGLGLDLAAQATANWRGRNNWQSAVHGGLDLAKDTLRAPLDILTGNFGGLFNDWGRDTAADQRTRNIAAEQSYYNTQIRAFRAQRGVGPVPRGAAPLPFIDPLVQRFQGSTNMALLQIQRQSGAATDTTNLAGATQASQALVASLQKRIEAEGKLFDTSQGQIKLDNGLTVSVAAYDAEMKKTGNNVGETTAFFQHHATVLDALKGTQTDLTTRQQNYNTFLTEAGTKYKLTETQVQAFSTALGLNYDKITSTAGGAVNLGHAVELVAGKFLNGNQAMQTWLATIGQLDLTSGDLATKVAVLGAGLTALQGVTNIMAGTNLNAASSFEGVANAVAQNRKSVSDTGVLLGQFVEKGGRWLVLQPKLTAGSLQIQQAMAQAAQSAVAMAQSIVANGGSVQQAAAFYRGARQQIINTVADQVGSVKAATTLVNGFLGKVPDKKFVQLLAKDDLTGAVGQLTKVLGHFSKQFDKILVKLGIVDNASHPLRNIKSTLDYLSGRNVTVFVNEVLKSVGSPRPGGPTGENAGPGPTKSISGLITGKATGGGLPEGVSAVGEGGLPELAIKRGPHVQILSNPQAKDFLAATGMRAPGFQGGTSPTPSLVTVTTPGAKAASAASAARSSKLQALINALLSAVQGIASISQNTAAQIKTATDSIVANVERIFTAGYTGRSTVDHFRADTGALVAEARRRDALLARIGNPNLPHKLNEGERLDAITQLTDTIRGGVLGRFDIGSSGQGYRPGILSTLRTDQRDASRFLALRARAKKLGLRADLLAQITSDFATNPEAASRNLQAIVGGGASYIKTLDATYASYKNTAQALADAQAKDTYGRTQAQELTLIRKLMHEEKLLQAKMNANLIDIRRDVHDLDRRLLAVLRQG